MAIVDFIYREEDLQIKSGDLLYEESEQDHIEDIVYANKGEYRNYPLVGVGILNVLNGNETIESISKRIALQLEYDNFTVEEITLEDKNDYRIVARQKEVLNA